QVFWIQAFAAKDLYGHLAAVFHFGNFASLVVVDRCGNGIVDTNGDASDVLVAASKGQHANDFDRHAFRFLDQSTAFAARAILVDASLEAGTDPLTRHFDQTKRTGP